MINSSISERDFQEYSELIEQGYSQRSACDVLSLSRSSVQRYLKKLSSLNNLNINGDDTTVCDKASNKPKVLFYDIETLPNISAHFGNWNENLPYKQRIQESCLLSHSWCWGDGEIHGSVLTPTEAINHDDERLVLELWSLLDNADIVIGQISLATIIKRLTLILLNTDYRQYHLSKVLTH